MVPARRLDLEGRLQYYSERFDTVEVDSPYYHLPDPGVTRNWAQRTPPEFTFHVKAHKTMTGHEGEPDDAAFAAFRASIEPLELSGKLRAILLQYHPRFVKSAEALAELERVRPRIEPSSRSSSSGTDRGWSRTSAPTRSHSSSATASRTCPSTPR